jgi:hypothetical protein
MPNQTPYDTHECGGLMKLLFMIIETGKQPLNHAYSSRNDASSWKNKKN